VPLFTSGGLGLGRGLLTLVLVLVCLLKLIRRKDGGIVNISRSVKCSFLTLWNMQLYSSSFEWKNVTFSGGQNILWLLLHIFMGEGPQHPRSTPMHSRRSGLAVTSLTAAREVLGSNRAVISIIKPVWFTVLCTFPAVPRSTQPFALHGTANKYWSTFGLSNNNKWRWWL